MTSDIRDRLGSLAEEATAGVGLQPIELALRVRRRHRRRLVLSTTAVAAVVGLATGLILAFQTARVVRVTTAPPSTAENLVPWKDQPAPIPSTPTPLPTAAPPANAPTCEASQVTMAATGGNGAGGHTAHYLSFTNISRSTCLLVGYPKVTATQPGMPPVTAKHGTFFPDPGATADIAPGAAANLTLETDRDCPATFSTPPSPPVIYNDVTVYLSGGSKTLAEPLDVVCGLSESRFGVPQPDSTYPGTPLSELKVSMELPAGVQPGLALNYVIDLTNPTTSTIELTPCPGYIEHSTELGAKEEYALNCNSQPAIDPNQTIRYAMRIQVSPTAAPGIAHVYWELIIGSSSTAQGTLELRR